MDDASRLVINSVQFKQDVGVTPAAPGQQFLYILPQIAQRIINTPENGRFSKMVSMNPNEVMGDGNLDKVWNKRFKLRIRSKNTGKEIDINFRFNLKVLEQEENKKVNLIC